MPKAQTRAARPQFLDDIPAFLRIPQDERRRNWDRNPPRAMPSFVPASKPVDPNTAALLQAIEDEKRRKQRAHFDKLKARKAQPDRRGMRWNSMKCRWERDGLAHLAKADGLVRNDTPKVHKTLTKAVVAPKDDLAAWVAALTSRDSKFDGAALKKFAKANGVWQDRYAQLSNGLQRMNVVNRLRGKIRKDPKYKVTGL